MNYPFWDVPYIGSGWVIGLIAIFHVMIALFAVGGGTSTSCWPNARPSAKTAATGCEALRGHSKFFLIFTGVFGTVSGVGIWFAIGLANPEATSALIHNFVFGWAMEWVFFIVELTSAAVYYYTWGRIGDSLHLKVGWLYAISSLCTLVIINGILAFMLTPGDSWLAAAGTGQEASRFWQAFFNPTYWPNLAVRCLVCASLAGVWALVTCSRIDGAQAAGAENLARPLERPLARPRLHPPPRGDALVFVARAGVAAGAAATGHLDDRQRAVHPGHAARRWPSSWPRPRSWRTPTFSPGARPCSFVSASRWSSSCSRWSPPPPANTAARCSASRTSSASTCIPTPSASATSPRLNADGYLARSLWTRPRADATLARGEAMFRGQCMACHTVDGYRSMKRLLGERNREGIDSFLAVLHEHKPDSPYRAFMPWLAGTKDEIASLAAYLATLAAGGHSEVGK